MIKKFALTVCCVLVMSACSKGLSPEQQEQVRTLRAEMDSTKAEVAAAQALNAQYSGGLLKTVTGLRVELLKTNEALLQQRIQSIEGGAPVKIETIASPINEERAQSLQAAIAEQAKRVEAARQKASNVGGLIGSLAHMEVATESNSLALLQQQYLIAKHGLAPFSPQISAADAAVSNPSSPAASGATSSAPPPRTGGAGGNLNAEMKMRYEILIPTVTTKQYSKEGHEEFMRFDLKLNSKGLDKPTRAVKGILQMTDLFDETQYQIKWTIEDPIKPGQDVTSEGIGFKYNPYIQEQKWVRFTELQNMKFKFLVTDILYQDGTTRKFSE